MEGNYVSQIVVYGMNFWTNTNTFSNPTIRLAFTLYDKDGSGDIELEEMINIFCLMYTMQVVDECVIYQM